MIIGIEKKRGYDKVVEELAKILAENYLYLKPELGLELGLTKTIMKSKQLSNRKLFASYNSLFSSLGEPSNIPMDWSEDTSVQTKPPLYVSLVGEHVPLPYVSLPQDIKANNSTNNTNIETIVLNYGNNQLTDLSLWNRTN